MTRSILPFLFIAALVGCDAKDDSAGLTGPVDDDAPVLGSIGVNTGVLTPPFLSGTTGYTVAVGSGVISISVTATALPGLGITVNGATVASGSPSTPIPLAVGANPIAVVVSDGTASRTYTVTVNRAQPPLQEPPARAP